MHKQTGCINHPFLAYQIHIVAANLLSSSWAHIYHQLLHYRRYQILYKFEKT